MGSIRDRQSAEYRKIRDELLEAESKLIDERERVAALRRKLPKGTRLDKDYVFKEGPADFTKNSESDYFETRLSQLFGEGKSELIVQHMMFAPGWEKGCPMCSMWVDGFDGLTPHLEDKASFVIVARAPLSKLREWARKRGWRNVRLLSSSDNTFNEDFGVEITPDRQLPALSIFTRDPGGDIYHFYTSEGSLKEAHHRAMDLLSPVWNLWDLLPSGRGNWMPKHFYHE